MSSPTPESILGLARAFMDSRILLTAAELDVFTVLAKKPMTLPQAADRFGTDPRGTAILLDALAAMGLLSKTEGRYACPPETAKCLSADAPGSVLPMVMHSVGLWRRWSNLTEVVRGAQPQVEPAHFDEPGQMEAFIGAMHVIGERMAKKVVAALGVLPYRNLLDVGGATGTYAEAFLAVHPDMRATLFDRPEVIELARKRLAASPLLARITLAEGDFYADELPGGHDMVLLSAIIHQNSPEQNVDLYRKCLRAMVSGGRLIIRDHVMSPDRTQPVGGAMFAVNMLAATPGGNSYTFDEMRETLAQAGFEQIRLIQTGEQMDGLVEAVKP